MAPKTGLKQPFLSQPVTETQFSGAGIQQLFSRVSEVGQKYFGVGSTVVGISGMVTTAVLHSIYPDMATINYLLYTSCGLAGFGMQSVIGFAKDFEDSTSRNSIEMVTQPTTSDRARCRKRRLASRKITHGLDYCQQKLSVPIHYIIFDLIYFFPTVGNSLAANSIGMYLRIQMEKMKALPELSTREIEILSTDDSKFSWLKKYWLPLVSLFAASSGLTYYYAFRQASSLDPFSNAVIYCAAYFLLGKPIGCLTLGTIESALKRGVSGWKRTTLVAASFILRQQLLIGGAAFFLFEHAQNKVSNVAFMLLGFESGTNDFECANGGRVEPREWESLPCCRRLIELGFIFTTAVSSVLVYSLKEGFSSNSRAEIALAYGVSLGSSYMGFRFAEETNSRFYHACNRSHTDLFNLFALLRILRLTTNTSQLSSSEALGFNIIWGAALGISTGITIGQIKTNSRYIRGGSFYEAPQLN